MKCKVYLRDWYFNAGIIGLLTIVADGKKLDSVLYLSVGENYIEFDNDIFEGFEEKFAKYAFLKFFNIQAYLQRLQKVLKELTKDLTSKKPKIKTDQLAKKIEDIEKSPYKNFLKLLNISITEYQSIEDFVAKLESAVNSIRDLPEVQIFETLNNSPEGKESLNIFSSMKFKGVCSHVGISKYIKEIKSAKDTKRLKSNDLCPSCQERKAEYEFNNAISNIIGFNKDNSNWIWGYKSSNLKICSLCALIYNCAFASFAYISKKVDNKYLNYFYFVNENTNVSSLFETVTAFNLMLDNIGDNSNILYAMVKQTVAHIMAKQSKSIAENINFVEIADNPILGAPLGGIKGYNIYNYNISSDIVEFLYLQFQADRIPNGYYKIKSTYYNIDEELLKLSIQRQIDYSILYKYFAYTLSSNIITKYNLNRITDFIIKYIQRIKGGSMEKSQTIVKKGFKSGINLRDALGKDKENQIKGLVYGFLNDLKIADREKFLDKYIRAVMSNNQPILFSEDEMLDNDYFLQFGYSFINGLMYEDKRTDNKNTDEIKEEE